MYNQSDFDSPSYFTLLNLCTRVDVYDRWIRKSYSMNNPILIMLPAKRSNFVEVLDVC